MLAEKLTLVADKIGSQRKKGEVFNEALWRVIREVYIRHCKRSVRADLTCHGGISALSRLTGANESNIRRWLKGTNKIPLRYIDKLVALSNGEVSKAELGAQ